MTTLLGSERTDLEFCAATRQGESYCRDHCKIVISLAHDNK
jgi:hypothetical protein